MKSNKSRAGKAQSRKPMPAKGPLRHFPGEGLMVNMDPGPFPQTAVAKIICAKHVIQAMCAAHDSEALVDEDYDIHWPLSLAIELLEQANRQLERESVKGGAG